MSSNSAGMNMLTMPVINIQSLHCFTVRLMAHYSFTKKSYYLDHSAVAEINTTGISSSGLNSEV